MNKNNTTSPLGHEIVQSLELAGIPADETHIFELYYYFPSNLSALTFSLSLDGELIPSVCESANESEWICIVKFSAIANAETLNDLESRLRTLAESHEGYLDGWERLPSGGESLTHGLLFSTALDLCARSRHLEAIPILENLAKQNNHQLAKKVFPLLGVIYFRERRYNESVIAFEKAAAFNPGDPEVLANFGAALSLCGRHVDAIPTLYSALRSNENHRAANYNLACAYSRSQDKPNALIWLAKATAIDSSLKHLASNDVVFLWLKDDPDFQSLVD